MKKDYIQKFRTVLRRFEREIFFQNTESCCNGITLTQCHTLLEIENQKEITVSKLANSLSLDKSTISRTVDGLVSKGMINRIIPADNRRTTILNLTKHGASTTSSINTESNKFVEENLNILNSEEQIELLRLLTKVTLQMEASRKRELKLP